MVKSYWVKTDNTNKFKESVLQSPVNDPAFQGLNRRTKLYKSEQTEYTMFYLEHPGPGENG